MEEAWMRDRALLRDLLRQHPQASPPGVSPHDRTLSQLGEEVAQAAHATRDPHDPSVLCSRSRAHHAPYFRWDVRVTQRIVEMRFSPPENADRVCLGLVPCSTIFPVTRSCKRHTSLCPAPVERNGAILHATGCLVTRSKESPHESELREPLEEIQMDAERCELRLA
jgi:hypothetical protein